jgi:hypothetical protein
MKQCLVWWSWGVWLLLVLSLGGGCADLANRAAKMHGLEVVSADDCRHALHTHPCKTVEQKP